MPTISSSRFQPLVTPSTALFTRARARPCTAACWSSCRVTWMWPSCCCSFTPAGRCVCTWPFGPCTTTVLPFTSNFTPCGSGIGFFPIRDIALNPSIKASPSSLLATEFHAGSAIGTWLLAFGRELGKNPGVLTLYFSLPRQQETACVQIAQPRAKSQWPRAGAPSARLPHFAQNLAAHAFLAGLAAGHHATGSGQDVDPQPAQHARNLIASHVHAASRPRDALQAGDGCRIVIPVLQVNAQDLPALFFRRLEIGDVTFFFQNACDFQLQLEIARILKEEG